MDLTHEILSGSPRAIARLISWIEDGDERAAAVLEALHPRSGRAWVIGVTGAPGSGKSTLTDVLTHALREREHTVGIVAVDPSSPFTGGAILGDRVRMVRAAADPGVYIRSMATRGALGGLARATADAVKVLDAAGKDVVIVETVGVGQDEVDIMGLADTTVLVLVPGLGDMIQSLKSGVMEIADVFAVNKADRPGADQLAAEVIVRVEQDGAIRGREWSPPVVRTVATSGEGVESLLSALEAHRGHLGEAGRLHGRRLARVRDELSRGVRDELLRRVLARWEAGGGLERLAEEVLSHRRTPQAVIREMCADMARRGPKEGP